MWFTYKDLSPEEMVQLKKQLLNANYGFVALSFVFITLAYVIRSYRWKYTLNHVGSPSYFLLNFFSISISYAMSLVIPRSGEVSRAYILTKSKGVPFDKAFGTIVSERIVDFFMLCFFVTIAVLVEYSTIESFLIETIPYKKIVIFLIVFLFILVVLVSYLIGSKSSFAQKVNAKINGLVQGVFSVFKMPYKWKFLIMTFAIWGCYLAMFYINVFSLEQTEHISFKSVLVAFVVGSLTITFTNGGFGFFPVLIGKILILYHIENDAAHAFGWIVWGSQLVYTILMGVISSIFLPIFVINEQKP